MQNNNQTPGRLIAFEGIDGSGKSTQSARLIQRLKQSGIPCYATREPTDSPIGSLIHQIMTGRMEGDPRTIAALFAADRLDHLLNSVNGIARKVESGVTVVSDRYYFSSYAYHSVDVPMEWVIAANAQSAEILKPAATVFIDLDPDAAMERIRKNRFDMELFETRERLTRVREKYLEAFERLSDRETIILVDGAQDSDALEQDIWTQLEPFFRSAE